MVWSVGFILQAWLSLTRFVTLGKYFNVAEPQLSHLLNAMKMVVILHTGKLRLRGVKTVSWSLLLQLENFIL